MGMKDLTALHLAHLDRIASRKHRPCRHHGPIKRPCPTCLKVICPECPPHPCRKVLVLNPGPPNLTLLSNKTRKRLRPSAAPTTLTLPPAITPVWSIVQPLGALSIEPQDGEQWLIRWPVTAQSVTHSEDFKMAILKLAPSLTMLVTITGTGKDITPKPGTWYLRVKLR